MSGLDEIIDKIIKDAISNANSTSEEASAKASEIIEVAKNDARIFVEKNMHESYIEREDIIKRKISAGNLETRKMILQTKQELLSEAFQDAVKEIKSNPSDYKNLIAQMIKQTEEGDIVVISKEDKDIISVAFVKEILSANKIKASVLDTYGQFSGGIIIKGKHADKNMSLEVILNEIRDEREPEIAEILFG
ncbi:MAG: V-type ATP synthase subunit E [Firmicutes bacterium ADurb.Bin080]|jgi:V/A-type H+/Na+-transporting ATPase subunit E|nr:hypothetical protein [Clostridiales bacterium]OQC14749.1 MAG: V-type ATP synthase subunit E [Firmicutes bacterium ADurb.Bin080]